MSGDRKMKWTQTLRPHWFQQHNVLAYGKYDTLQIPYISHFHRNQKFWTSIWAPDKYYNIYWLYSWQYIFRRTNTAWFERIKRWCWEFKSSATWRFVAISLDLYPEDEATVSLQTWHITWTVRRHSWKVTFITTLKRKVYSVHITKWYTGSGDIAPLILTIGAMWRQEENLMNRLLHFN